MIVLAELQPYDPVAATRKTLRAASANDDRVTGLNSLSWIPAISGEPAIGIRLFKGDFDGNASPTAGSIDIQIDKFVRPHLEVNARKFDWSAAPVKLWAGVAGQAWPWTQVGEAIVDSFEAEGNTVALRLKANEEPFDANVLTLKYAGTGGVEGPTDLKGKDKPFLLGRCFNAEPVLIDAVNNVYQFSGYGPIQAVSKLYERGSEFPAPLADYASYAALIAATVPSAQWATCLASGLIRLGAPAYGVITGDVDGDTQGGTWRRKTGEIILRLLSNAAISSGIIETASFTALDTALVGLSNQGRIGAYITAQDSVLSLAASLAAPCNAQVGVSLLGKIFASRAVVGAPALVLDAQQRQKPRVTRSVEQSVLAPYSFMEFGYARSWRVHSDDEIAGFDSRPTVRYPEPPPDFMLIGGIYIDATNKQFRYVGPSVFSDEGNITSDEGLVTSSGYEDIQDLAILAAQASAEIAQALANDAQATADGKVESFYQTTPPLAASEGDLWFDTDDGNNQYRYTSGSWIDVQDTGIGQAISDAAGAQATADGKVTTFIGETAPTAEALGDLWFKESTGELRRWDGTIWSDPLVDLTIAAQINTEIAGGASKTIAADYQGGVTGSYPTFAPSILRNGVSIKSDTLVTYTATKLSDGTTGADGGTISLSSSGSSKGDVTPSAFSSGASVISWRLTVSYDGVVVARHDCTLTKEQSAPPSSSNKLATVSANQSQSTTSYAIAHSAAAPQLVVASGEKLYASGQLTYGVSGNNRSGTFKNQYSSDGSSWTDFGSAINGSTATAGRYIGDDWFEEVPGTVDVAQNVTPSAGTYFVRTVFIISATGQTITLYGQTITFEAKV